MTLGNSPQPLTRRQLRELARENEPASTESAAKAESEPVGTSTPHASRHTSPPSPGPAAQTPAAQKPAAQKPAAQKPAAQKPAVQKPEVQKPEVQTAAARPAPAPLPIPGEGPTARAAAAPTPQDAPAPSSAPDSVVKPEGDGPVASESAVGESVVRESVVRESVVGESVVGESVVGESVVIDSVVVHPGRALTRRELRALQVAASAEPAPIGAVTSAALPGGATETPGLVRDAVYPDSRGTVPESALTAGGLNPPVGHWSVDPDDDSHIQAIGRRDDQTFDDLVGNGVGAGGIPTTTNALILPAIPRQGSSGPIASTGEIMITGSIDLPRSLGATGQHPNLFDSSEMDRMLDQLDEGGHHNDVAPVSASRAVSTHTSTRGVMTPPRKRGASLPTVLAITAAVLAIGVLSLFVVGYAFNIY
jgi:hypothetical protein